MKRFAALALTLGLIAVGCNKKTDTPTSPNTPQTVFVFNATALPANEIPAISNAENTGRAVAGFTLTVTRDSAGVITGGKGDFGVTVSGFPSTTTFTIMHVHEGNAATNGPIRVNSGLTSGEVSLLNGGAQVNKLGIDVAAPLAQAIINDPSQFYFNIHTVVNGGGVARAQLVRVQ